MLVHAHEEITVKKTWGGGGGVLRVPYIMLVFHVNSF